MPKPRSCCATPPAANPTSSTDRSIDRTQDFKGEDLRKEGLGWDFPVQKPTGIYLVPTVMTRETNKSAFILYLWGCLVYVLL